MIKYFGPIFCIGLLLFGITLAGIKEDFSQFENSTNMHNEDMYLINYYPVVQDHLAKNCSPESISETEKYSQMLKNLLQKKRGNLNVSEQLLESIELHDRLKQAQSKLGGLSDDDYCILKYVLYELQDRIRDYHLGIMEATGIIKDFDGFVLGGSIHGYAAKVEMLNGFIQELSIYKDELGIELQFNTPETIISSDNQRNEIGNKTLEVMKLTIYKSFVELMRAGLFDQTDIHKLNGKLTLLSRLSCNTFHGNYNITETTDHHGNHISFSTLEVPLDVNVCGNYFLLKDLPDHFYKIVIHEFGHHFYYHKDREGHAKYEDMCRGENKCSPNDFVSDYAQINPLEDYADHFMYRFLNESNGSSSILEQKNAYFDKFLSD